MPIRIETKPKQTKQAQPTSTSHIIELQQKTRQIHNTIETALPNQ